MGDVTKVLSFLTCIIDSADWSNEDVAVWLRRAAQTHQIDVQIERFPVNGRGLNFLTKEMFIRRVPNGGALLYEYFQHKYRSTKGQEDPNMMRIEIKV